MGASSVTGVGKGAGFSNKGPQNGRDVYVPLNSPHVVAAGKSTMSTGTCVVNFSTALSGDKTGYIVLLTGQGATTTVARITSTGNDSSGNFSTFTITAGTSDVVGWAVINLAPSIANLV